MFDILFDIFGSIVKIPIELLFSLGESILSPRAKDNSYSADFLNENEVLKSKYKGFSLTGNKNLSVHDSFSNALVMGGSGSGKSVICAQPSIYNIAKNGGSMIVHDPSSELYNKSAEMLLKLGYDIKILNYARADITEGYNPFSRAKNDSELSKVVTLLIQNALGKESKDPFWSNSGIMLVTLIAKMIYLTNREKCNPQNIKYILDIMASKPETLDYWAVKLNNQSIFTEYKIFAAMDKKLLTSIISTARSAFMIFADKQVQLVTSIDTINFSDFREQKTALFITNPTGDIGYYSTITSIFFEQLFSYFMSELPKPDSRPVFQIIDEVSSLKLPTLPLALANLRKFRIATMLLAQDFNQLISNFGKEEAEAIRSNCFAKLYFPGQSVSVCRELETLLGKYEFENEKGNKEVRPLMTADEIRIMKKNTALIFTGSNRAINANLTPYFKHYRYKRYARLPIPNRERILPPLLPELIKIPKYDK